MTKLIEFLLANFGLKQIGSIILIGSFAAAVVVFAVSLSALTGTIAASITGYDWFFAAIPNGAKDAVTWILAAYTSRYVYVFTMNVISLKAKSLG